MKNNRQDIYRQVPDITKGLDDIDVKMRKAAKYINTDNAKTSKSYLKIVLENTFTFFSCIAYIILAFLLICKYILNLEIPVTKFAFIAPIIISAIIGTIQQIKSKLILEKLNIMATSTYMVIRNSEKIEIKNNELVADDIYELTAGKQVPADGTVLSGNIEVNESMLTGEPNNISKNINDKILAGSYVISGKALCHAESVGSMTYISKIQHRMKAMAENKSELMKNINNIIKTMSIVLIFILVITSLSIIYKMQKYDFITVTEAILGVTAAAIGSVPSGLVLLTSITLAISVINLAKKKVLIQDLYSLENLSHVDTICLDKTGTLTTGKMKVSSYDVVDKSVNFKEYIGSFINSVENSNQTSAALLERFKTNDIYEAKDVKQFTSARKMSSVTFTNGSIAKLGAPEYVLTKDEFNVYSDMINAKAELGYRIIVFSINDKAVAFIYITDVLRKNTKQTIKYFYENNVDIKIISGDNPITVSNIAKQCGIKNADLYINMQDVADAEIDHIVDKYVIFGRITPEQKERVVKALQNKKHKVAMTGDGINDVLALKAADCSISFNTATDSAKNISDVVLLDDSFDFIPSVVLEGRKVVSNITRTSTLFLTKTFFVLMFSFVSLFFKEGITLLNIENLYIFEWFVIAIGGLLLSIEPNKNPITGSFVENTYPRALTNGVFLLTAALTAIGAYKFGFIENKLIADSLMCILITVSGYSIFWKLCQPQNLYRCIVFSVCLGLGIIMFLAVPDLFLNPESVITISDIKELFINIFDINKSIIHDFTVPVYVTIIGYMSVLLPLYLIINGLITLMLKRRIHFQHIFKNIENDILDKK